MKRSTAIASAKAIGAYLRGLGGCISTPYCMHNYVRVYRVWVFGSTAKGKSQPNDLDLLISCECIGRDLDRPPRRRGSSNKSNGYYRYKKDSSGRLWIMDSLEEAKRSIRGNRRMIRIHEDDIDGELAWPRVMIYPRDDTHLLEEMDEAAYVCDKASRNPA